MIEHGERRRGGEESAADGGRVWKVSSGGDLVIKRKSNSRTGGHEYPARGVLVL